MHRPPARARTADYRRWARWLGLASFAFVALCWIVFAFLGDRAWWSVAIIFGPRWVFALPALGMIPWLAVEWRVAVVPTVLATAMALFGIIDFRLALHRVHSDGGVPMRVLELNADGSAGPADKFTRIMALIRNDEPEIAIFAECDGKLADSLATLANYAVKTSSPNELCLLSRDPIIDWSQRDQRAIWRQDGSGAIVRAVIQTGIGPLRIGLVHLDTPRKALDNYRDLSRLPEQGPVTLANMAQRVEESDLARQWIMQGPPLPTIIAGDFNLPVESAIYRRYWGDFRNAFGRAGWGPGYTKHTRHWGVRIDHILTSNDIDTRNSFVEPSVGSDHWPLVADLLLPATSR